MTNKGNIYVIDMESSLAQEIATRLVNFGVYVHFLPWDSEKDHLETINSLGNIRGIIISGSHKNIHGKNFPTINEEIVNLGIPILGICYGHQLLGHIHGSKIVKCNGQKGEEGIVGLKRKQEQSEIFSGLGQSFPVWMKHNWMIDSVPEGWKVTSSTQLCPIASMEKDHLYGVQFHPEPFHSLWGRIILFNFLERVCDITTNSF